jgi:hypothetical protein
VFFSLTEIFLFHLPSIYQPFTAARREQIESRLSWSAMFAMHDARGFSPDALHWISTAYKIKTPFQDRDESAKSFLGHTF